MIFIIRLISLQLVIIGLMLTILIPCYNEESIIENTAHVILEWTLKQKFQTEIIFINNNSNDKTGEILTKLETKKGISFTTESIQGKGAAIKKGVQESNFEKILILDADLSANITESNKIDFFEDEVLVLGSRVLGSEENTPFFRIIVGTFFNFVIRQVFKFDYLDTQCGFKYISSERVKHIFKNITSQGFLYDIDLILQSKNLNLKIIEQPVDYKFHTDSSVSVIYNLYGVIKDIYKLRKKYTT